MSPRDVNPVSAAWLKVESAVAAFEGGTRRGPDAVRAHVPPADDPLHLPVLCELVRADLEFAWAGGVPRFLDDYRPAFPALFASPDHLRQVAFEEYRLRVQAGDRPAADEYARRYGVMVTGAEEPPRTDPMLSLPPTDYTPSVVHTGGRPAGERPFGHTEQLLDPEPAEFPAPGRSFAGFKLVKELGRGAFARVYLAEQPDLAGRPVVLKVSSELVEESQTLARLQHTNIVPVHSAHRVGRWQAVCMPFFGAATLADLLGALRHRSDRPTSGEHFFSTVNQRRDESVTDPTPPADALPAAPSPLDRFRGMTHTAAVLWVGAELADGLAHAHDRGILHRDLKPANVLIADDGRPMLLDFNLAAAAGRPVETAGGTPMYMAPEQLDALRTGTGTPDPRSDVYSLGLMLYELLTGRLTDVPAKSGMAERLAGLRAERANVFPSARSLNPAVTAAEASILARCLHPDPERRYASAHQLRDDLRAHLDHRPLVHAPEPSVRERLAKFARRNPWVKSAAFVGSLSAVLLLALGVVLWVVLAQRDAAAREVATRQFRDELADHKLTLIAPGGERQTTAAVEKAKRTLTRFGLPGGDGEPEVKLTATGPLADEVADLHLLLAAAEASRPGGGRERAAEWLALAERGDRRKQVERFRQLMDGQGTPTADADDLSSLVVGRHEPRKLIDALNARPPADLQPGHWVAKGECHSAVGEYAEAVGCFTTALALHGRPNAALYAHRGRALLELKQLDRALADFDAALEHDPDAAPVFLDRGLVRLRSGQPRQAVSDFDRALELWPEHTRVYFLRAEAKARLKDTAGAAADHQLGMTTEPGDETSWVSRGMAKLNGGNAKGAIADFDAALMLNPNSRDARQNKAGALADHLGKVADAVTVLDELIEDEPDFIPARAGRGVYLARLGKRDLAHADAAEVLKRNPPPLFRYQVAGVFALTSTTHPKDADEAVKLLAAALHDRGGLEHVDTDPDLVALRKDARFQSVVQAAKKLSAPLATR
jgi:serine/threonine protein kinase/lipoprotein NlpI